MALHSVNVFNRRYIPCLIDDAINIADVFDRRYL